MTMDTVLPMIGITPEDLLVLMAGVSAFLTIIFVWQALLVRDPGAKRVKGLSARRDALKAGITAAPRRQARPNTIGFMRQTVNRMKLMRGMQARRTSDRLAQAGFRSRDAMIVYLFMKVATPMIFGVAALFLLFVLGVFSLQPMVKFAAALGAVALGAYTPELFVKNTIDKRRKELQKGMPDALDLMVICAEAGLSLDSALARVAKESSQGCPQIADEFEVTSIELGFLPERRTALENLAKRTGLAQIRALVNALMQTEKYGTPLSQSLRVLSNEMRNDRLMKAEEKAARLPALLTVPMVIFILPCLFIVLIGPGILRAIDGFSSL